jgi:hypothetical protein
MRRASEHLETDANMGKNDRKTVIAGGAAV